MSQHVTRLSSTALVRELKRAENMLKQLEQSSAFARKNPRTMEYADLLEERIALIEAEIHARGTPESEVRGT